MKDKSDEEIISSRAENHHNCWYKIYYGFFRGTSKGCLNIKMYVRSGLKVKCVSNFGFRVEPRMVKLLDNLCSTEDGMKKVNESLLAQMRLESLCLPAYFNESMWLKEDGGLVPTHEYSPEVEKQLLSCMTNIYRHSYRALYHLLAMEGYDVEACEVSDEERICTSKGALTSHPLKQLPFIGMLGKRLKDFMEEFKTFGDEKDWVSSGLGIARRRVKRLTDESLGSLGSFSVSMRPFSMTATAMTPEKNLVINFNAGIVRGNQVTI